MQRRTISFSEKGRSQCVLVARAIASSIETILGPCKSLKCCQSSGATIITSSTSKVVEFIDVEHPAGFLINDACQSFHKQFGCGSTTLVCLIGYWAKALHDLSDLGVPTPAIAAVIHQAFQELEMICKKSSISLKSLQDKMILPTNLKSVSSVILPDEGTMASFCFREQLVTDEDTRREGETRGKTEQFHNCVQRFGYNYDVNCEAVKRDFFIFLKGEEAHLVWCKTKRLPCDISSQDEAEEKTKYRDSTLNHEPALNKNFVCTQIRGPSLIQEKLLTPLGRKASESDDEFDACFDGISEKCAETLKQPGSPKKKTAVTPVCKLSIAQLEISDGTRIQQFVQNKAAKRPSFCDRPGKTNPGKVFLKSRHFVDMSKKKLTPDSLDKTDSQLLSKDKSVKQPKEQVCRQHNDAGIFLEYNNLRRNEKHASIRLFEHLGRNLAHGREWEMNFAVEILKKQFFASDQFLKNFSFSVDCINLQTVIGPPSSGSRVVEGVVVLISKENESILQTDANRPRHLALVSGDIVFNYRHTGLNKPVEVVRVFDKNDFSVTRLSEQTEWITKVESAVQTLDLGVVATRGEVDNALRDSLLESGVVVLENLNHRQLEILSRMTRTPIVSYLLDFSLSDVGEPVVIRVGTGGLSLQSHLKGSFAKTQSAETVTFGQVHPWTSSCSTSTKNQMVQTLVLCTPVPDLAGDSELKFWNCLNRLRNALHDQRVLPGGGEMEQRCIKHLEEIRDVGLHDENVRATSLCRWTRFDCIALRPLVFDALINGLKEFVSRLQINSAQDIVGTDSQNSLHFSSAESQKCVLDNYTSKIEAWKRAIRVVKLLLCSEYHIVTGIQK